MEVKTGSMDTSIDPDTYFAMEDIHHEIEEMAYTELCQKLSQLTGSDSMQEARMEETRRVIRERALQIVRDRMRIRDINLDKAAMYCMCKDREWNGPYAYKDRLIDIPNIGRDDRIDITSDESESEEYVEFTGFVAKGSDDHMRGKGLDRTGIERIGQSTELDGRGSQDKSEGSMSGSRIARRSRRGGLSSPSQSADSSFQSVLLDPAKDTKSRPGTKDYMGLSYEQRKQIGYAHGFKAGIPISGRRGRNLMGEDEIEDESYNYDDLLYSTIDHLGNYYFDEKIKSWDGKNREHKMYLAQELGMQEGYDFSDIDPYFWIRKMIDDLIDFQLLLLTSEMLGNGEETPGDMISEIMDSGMEMIQEDLQRGHSLDSFLFPEERQFCNEDLEYLKASFGNSLILAMASTTMVQPKSPITYFAQFLLMNKNIPGFAADKRDDLDSLPKLKDKSGKEFERLNKQKEGFSTRIFQAKDKRYHFPNIGKIFQGRGKRLRKDIIDTCNKMLIDTPLSKLSRNLKKDELNKYVFSSIVTLRERLSMEVDLIKQEEKSLLHEEVISILKTILPDLENMQTPQIFMRYLSEFVGANRILTYQGPTSSISVASTGKMHQESENDFENLGLPKDSTLHNVDIDEIVSKKLSNNVKGLLDGFFRKSLSGAYSSKKTPLYMKLASASTSIATYGEDSSSEEGLQKVSIKSPCQRPTIVTCDTLCNLDTRQCTTDNKYFIESTDVVKITEAVLKRTSVSQTEDPYSRFRMQSQLNVFVDSNNKVVLNTIRHIEKNEACILCESIKRLMEMKLSMSRQIKKYEIDYIIDWICDAIYVIIDKKISAKMQEKYDDRIMLLNGILPILNNKLVFENANDINSVKEKMTAYISAIIEEQVTAFKALKHSQRLKVNSQIANIFCILFLEEEEYTNSHKCCCNPNETEYFSVPKGNSEAKSIETQMILEDILYLLVDNLNELDLNMDSLQQIQEVLESFVSRAARQNPYLSSKAKESFENLSQLIVNMYSKNRDVANNRVRSCYCKWILYLANIINEVFDTVEKMCNTLYLNQKENIELEIMKMFAILVDGLTLDKLQAQVLC